MIMEEIAIGMQFERPVLHFLLPLKETYITALNGFKAQFVVTYLF